MTPGGPTSPSESEWAGWEPMLSQFAQTTSCTVSVYDRHGQAVIGPIVSSDTGRLFDAGGFFGVHGAGRRFEQGLVAQASLRMEPVEAAYQEQLTVVAVPIVMFGGAFGAVTFGWLPLTFATALGAERIARTAGLDGRRLWMALRLQPPLGAARLAVYTRLLGNLIAMQARLRETLREIDQSGQLREEQLARVAHELRTPLSSVMLRLSALLNTPLNQPDQIKTALEAIVRNVREESRMIDDIIDTGRSRTGQMSIKRVRCVLADVVASAIATVQPQADAKGVVLERRAWDGEDHVDGDPGRLQQALWNILSNAVKFTPAGGRVVVSHSRRDDMHDISVSDTGAGIERAMLPKVFEPFVRERANNDTGLGLGLSIARHIVELHGGRVRVSSEGKGHGTTFTVTLPTRASP